MLGRPTLADLQAEKNRANDLEREKTNLQQEKNNKQYGSKDLDLDINNINLDELNLQEDLQGQTSLQAQVELPPKK